MMLMINDTNDTYDKRYKCSRYSDALPNLSHIVIEMCQHENIPHCSIKCVCMIQAFVIGSLLTQKGKKYFVQGHEFEYPQMFIVFSSSRGEMAFYIFLDFFFWDIEK